MFEIAPSATAGTLGPMDKAMELHEWIDKGLKKPGRRPSRLAKLLKIGPDKVSKMRSGERQIQAHELPIIEAYLEERAPVDMPESLGLAESAPIFGDPAEGVRVIGYVGDGAEVHYYAVAKPKLDRVHAPESATASTVALELRTDSLGALYDRWFLFYDHLGAMAPPQENELSIVAIPDGRVFVAKLIATKKAGIYEIVRELVPGPALRSAITWIAKVKLLAPRR